MIKPTIGRVVWYRPAAGEAIPHDRQPLAALVAYVHNDRLVNLTVSDMRGYPHARQKIALVQEGEPPPVNEAYAEWMPYQKAVAKGEIAPTLHATPRQGTILDAG